ncbi:MAG: prephenate dehydratase [Chloroflexi bacterium]|nr:prephenate dehydratase [Chloroflexota bacterium]
MPARLAFLGPRGTNTEAAALRYAPAATLVAGESITGVTELVLRGEADEAIVPIENSLQGSVTETVDLLVHSLPLRIKREVVVPIEAALIAGPGTAPADVTTVYSHPQALAQSRQYLRATLPGAQQVATLSTAQAVERVVAEPGAAAIAPPRAAAIYGGVILAQGVQDDPRNSTRFVVLAPEDAPPSGDDKTSIVFNVDDEPGALVRIMLVFADAGINLTKIESRPAREALGVYVFLLDCQGHRLDPVLQDALATVDRQCRWLKILGSYPLDAGPEPDG